MKRNFITAIAVTLLTAGAAFAADQSPPEGAHGAAKPGLPAAVETDPRVQANGTGWRLDQAVVTDAKRPRVLLIGDSILNGYLPYVKRALAGKVYVDAWVNPNFQSERYNQLLAEVLATGPFDVVHFNMGLHGWPTGRIKEGTFEPLTMGFVEVIQRKCPGAKMIWASSTPVTVKGQPTELDPVINANIMGQNRMAAQVMAEMHVPVNDFYGLLIDKLRLAHGDGFHWTAPAYKILARACVNSILQALPATAQPSPAKDAPAVDPKLLPPPSTQPGVTYATDIQPIFAKSCYPCHGPKTAKPKGKLRLDTLAAVLKGGEDGAALVVGDSAKSVMVAQLAHQGDPDDYMPPPKNRANIGPLTKEQIGLIRAWIDQGAK